MAGLSSFAVQAGANEVSPLISALRKLNESPSENRLEEVLRVWQALQTEGRAGARERRWVPGRLPGSTLFARGKWCAWKAAGRAMEASVPCFWKASKALVWPE